VGIAFLVITAIGLLAVIYFSLQIESGVRASVDGEASTARARRMPSST
jgi:hypothetical protein